MNSFLFICTKYFSLYYCVSFAEISLAKIKNSYGIIGLRLTRRVCTRYFQICLKGCGGRQGGVSNLYQKRILNLHVSLFVVFLLLLWLCKCLLHSVVKWHRERSTYINSYRAIEVQPSRDVDGGIGSRRSCGAISCKFC